MSALVLTAIGKLGEKVIFSYKIRYTLPIDVPFSFPPKLPEITFPFKLPPFPEFPNLSLPTINIPGLSINIPLPEFLKIPFKIPGIPFPPAIPIPSINLPTIPQLPTLALPAIAVNIPLPKLPFLNIKLPFSIFPPSLPVFSFSLPKIPDLPSMLLPNFYPFGAPTITVTVTLE